jgi:hypothetical protein
MQRPLSPAADIRHKGGRQLCAISRREQVQQLSVQKIWLLDHLVGTGEERWRHVEAQRLGGRHIEHGLVFHRQLHRQIGRLLALKDAVDVGGGAASMAYLVRPI